MGLNWCLKLDDCINSAPFVLFYFIVLCCGVCCGEKACRMIGMRESKIFHVDEIFVSNLIVVKLFTLSDRHVCLMILAIDGLIYDVQVVGSRNVAQFNYV